MVGWKKALALLVAAFGIAAVGVYAQEILPDVVPDAVLFWTYVVGMTAIPGVVTYLRTRPDFGDRGVALATAVSVVAGGAAAVCTFVFGLFAFLVVAALHLVLRRFLRAVPALAVSAVVLAAGLGYATLVMTEFLNRM
ncbi:hypothetical protein [Saccharopolyspora sp. SCSIO 74807]|uniref:hypothetical protein n=1 Tax=Saccharopolyspora sp. SCSIO 74807 TaxID=3118084 RepID=UPI0030CC0714